MTFKRDWEKRSEQHQLPSSLIEGMIQWALPWNKLASYHVLPGGCSNLNIKVRLEGDTPTLLLRVYLGDRDAADRERAISALLRPSVPVPRTFYVGNHEGHRFAITEFISGMPLRDLLLSNEPYDLEGIMQEVGLILAKITTHQFSKAGFFDNELSVSEVPNSYLPFIQQCLQQEVLKSQFEYETLLKIHHYVEKQAHLFPNQEERNLVHADFDPANILVDQIDGVWKITGILDWEYSFSGSVLCDVANMLRYAHQMPAAFETSFLKGLQSGSVTLPHDWRERIDLLNLLALLDCLARSNPEKSPRQCEDICSLIEEIIGQ